MLHIYCSNAPGEVIPGTTGRAVPGYELRLVEMDGTVLKGPAVGALEVSGDSCAGYYWHQHEKSKQSMKGEWFATGDRYSAARTAPTYTSGASTTCSRSAVCGSPRSTWSTYSSPIPASRRRRRRDHARGLEPDRRIHRMRGRARRRAAGRRAAGLCREHLRRYEYPHVVEFVPALPRTLTGKVQRFKPARARAAGARGHRLTSSP